MSTTDSRSALSRRSLLKFGSLLAAGGAVGGGLTVAGTTPSQAATPIHWTQLRSEASKGSLAGVAASGSATWAVGSIGDGDDTRPLAMQLKNRSWQPTAQPAPDLASLSSVAIVSKNEVWAVGEQIISDESADLLPVIVRWNGSAWHKVNFPAKIGGLGQIVVAAGSIWVVGWAKVGGSEHAVVYRRTNGKWKLLDKGLESAMNVNCLQVFDDGTAWAGLNPGLAYFDGTSWTLSSDWPQDGSMIPSKFICSSAKDIYVAGVAYTGDLGMVPLISHYNGKTWRRLKTPKVQADLYDLAFYKDQVVAVGERYDDEGTSTQLVLRGDKSGFSVQTAPTTQPGGLAGLLNVSGELLTVGYLDQPTTLEPFAAISQSRWTM